MKPLKVYVAGPYAKPDPVINTRNAILAGEEIIKLGYLPFVPHLTHLWHLVEPHEPDFWYSYDLEWLECCDILLRLPGESWGADREVEFAKEHGIQVIFSITQLELVGEY